MCICLNTVLNWLIEAVTCPSQVVVFPPALFCNDYSIVYVTLIQHRLPRPWSPLSALFPSFL